MGRGGFRVVVRSRASTASRRDLTEPRLEYAEVHRSARYPAATRVTRPYHASDAPDPPSRLSPAIRHCDECGCGARLLGYDVGSASPACAPTVWGACVDAYRWTRGGRNRSTAGEPACPGCSADTASACRSFGCFGNHYIWCGGRSAGTAAMRGARDRRSDQSAARAAVRSGRTPARTNSS